MKLRIAFFLGKKGKLLDKLIAWKLGGPFSHSTLFIPNRGWFSAHPFQGVCYIVDEVEENDRWVILEKDVTPEQMDRLTAYCDAQVAKHIPYNFFGALSLGVPFFFSLPGSQFCSQSNELALDQIWTDNDDASKMDPNELYQHLTGYRPHP